MADAEAMVERAAPTDVAAHYDHIVYVRVIEACNLHCRHCFIPNNPARMSDEQKAHLGDEMRRFARPGQTVIVQWHGGEPTLVGRDWLWDAIDQLEAACPDINWIHGIQTNAMTYDASWAELYHARFGGEVGVSWDPEIRQFRAGRPDTNADFEAKFWPQLRQMQNDGLRPYLVVTGTRAFFNHFRQPTAFFRFLEENGIYNAHIERLTKTGYAVDHWDELGLTNNEFSEWMSRWAKAYFAWNMARESQGEPRLNLSPFDGLYGSVRDLREGVNSGGYGCWSGECDTRFHTIDARSGYQKGCTAVTAEASGTPAKEVSGDPTAKPVMFFKDMRRQRTAHCSACPYQSICSTGCLNVEYLDESGECSGGFGLFRTLDQLYERFRRQRMEATHE